jgi:hypothetical protein
LILFYEGEIRDGTGHVAGKRLFAFYSSGREVSLIPPAILWDLAEAPIASDYTVDMENVQRRVSGAVIVELERYKEEILDERNRQAVIKKKYGISSLDHLIVNLDGDLIALYDRREQGESVDLVIHNKEARKNTYMAARDALCDQIEKEKSLTMSMPRFVGVIKVHPEKGDVKDMAENEEIELIGMQTAIAYERDQGRCPEDVSAENLGFDIRSKDELTGEIRYIEVKGRAATGPVAFTQNEWFKARRFKDAYYLYAVMNAAKTPELYVVRNPAENLSPEERIEVVRYVVPPEEIKSKGQRKA